MQGQFRNAISAIDAELRKAGIRPGTTAGKGPTGAVERLLGNDTAKGKSKAKAKADTAPEAVSEDGQAGEAPAEQDGRKPGAKRTRAKAGPTTDGKAGGEANEAAEDETTATEDQAPTQQSEESAEGEEHEGGGRRRRRRGGRRRRKSGDGETNGENNNAETKGESQGGATSEEEADTSAEGEAETDHEETGGEGTSRRRRRRRRSGDDSGDSGDESSNTVTRVRRQRNAEDEITAVAGSTRLEAKKQRRREGREAGRRRAPIVSEAEFLARRESVERVMVIRQRDDLTQIGVLEDKVLVEHYVARESQTSLIGNVYLGRVQNVLPSMEAAFIDIGKGRNAVLYAGEVNWSALGHREGQPRKIESVLTSGQPVLVQVTKDPIGHKGARLTSQISLAGRFLVYVPDGTTSGISRKLPDTERNRLKTLLKEIVPDSAGVIVRTAAEGASEDELTRDVERLKARWEDIERKTKGNAPQLLYGEPDLTLKVVRDLFTEDFAKLVIEGDDAWDTVQGYVAHVAPDLEERLERFEPHDNGKDVFATYRIDEQIAKGLDRKVWLPSGGSLIIDRTEAMTVVDVNTGKFTGSGGNLEETVTKNNLEAAEEIVRQLRLRDIGGIIVVDFIDMVLESNRDLVLRRLVECLGRDRTRHQVAEVTSLGLVQMTRKRIGTGLVESFSENCEHCQGRGVVIKDAPVEPKRTEDDARRGSRRSRGGRGRGQDENGYHDGG
ncbi:MAG TPA: Rne/Rng family ribonuclease, partial [Lapillicoccus sp.]|nr:Rne/Rng family ribonuclease [Lapillicoccus sp.]